MIFIELTLSTLTLLSIWMITNRKRGGIVFGLALQFVWVYYWIFVTQQFGFVLIDLGMAAIFIERLLQNCRAWNRFVER